jgi:glycine/D-amino acid oxidase-like deaminating enzyme
MTEEGANKVSRRSFMKTAALAAGGAAGVALAAEVVTPLAAKEKLVFDSNQARLRAADQPKRNPPLDRNLEVDVAVIGGGFTGLSSAYHLKKLLPGKSVALLEARGVGHGASGRNGGMMLCQPIDEYMKIGDPKTHKRSYDETANAIDEVRDLMKAHGLGSGIWKLGALETCMSRERYESKKPYAAKAEAMGIPIEAWDRDRVADALGTDVYFGGLYDPNGAEVNPMKMVHALKRAAESEGCAIYEDSPVIGVEDGKQIALHVAPDEDTRYRVVASAVVLGTNGYTSKLGYMNWKVIALHTEMGATPPLGENIFSEIGWKSRITFHDDNAFLYHLGSTEDNRILIGGGNAEYFFNNGIVYKKDVEVRRKALAAELVRIYPKLEGVGLEYIWTGVLGWALGARASVGVIGDHQNVYYGLGYEGHGVCLSYLFGKVIADLYAGKMGKWREMPFVNRNFPPLVIPEPLRSVGVRGYLNSMRAADVTA